MKDYQVQLSGLTRRQSIGSSRSPTACLGKNEVSRGGQATMIVACVTEMTCFRKMLVYTTK